MAEAGSRFESEVRTAMRERGITTLADLERRTGIKRRSWEDWFAGIHAPRIGSLSRAERVLHRSPDQLLAVWDGNGQPRRRAPQSDSGILAATLVADAIREQTSMLERLLERLAPLPVRPHQEEAVLTSEQEAEIAEAETQLDEEGSVMRRRRSDRLDDGA